MKKSILFFTFLFFSTFSFASFPVSDKLESGQSTVSEISFPVSETISTKTMSFFKSIKESLGIEWGSFLVGFLLGLLGVLLVWIFDGDTKSAWKGFGAWLILILALNFLVLAAV